MSDPTQICLLEVPLVEVTQEDKRPSQSIMFLDTMIEDQRCEVTMEKHGLSLDFCLIDGTGAGRRFSVSIVELTSYAIDGLRAQLAAERKTLEAADV